MRAGCEWVHLDTATELGSRCQRRELSYVTSFCGVRGQSESDDLNIIHVLGGTEPRGADFQHFINPEGISQRSPGLRLVAP